MSVRCKINELSPARCGRVSYYYYYYVFTCITLLLADSSAAAPKTYYSVLLLYSIIYLHHSLGRRYNYIWANIIYLYAIIKYRVVCVPVLYIYSTCVWLYIIIIHSYYCGFCTLLLC
jgi:hypothetical protein